MKKRLIVPDHKPYKVHADYFTIGIIAALGIVFTIFFSSCNPTKRAYKAIEKLPPITNKDSGRLAKRSLATFPVKPPIVKEGKTIIVKGRDSSQYFKELLKIAESKKVITKKEIELRYKDTCTTAQDTYEAGYKLGHEVGVFDGRKDCPPPTERVDTFEVIPPAYEVQLRDAQIQATAMVEKDAVLQDKLDSSNKWKLWLIIACLVLLSGNILQFKKIL